MKHVFISLINFNGRKNTLDCLKSLRNIKKDNFKLTIMVMDNASKEKFDLKSGSIENIPLIVIKNETNLGFSGGHNVGIKYALENGADYVLILNNDTYAHEDFLKELLAVLEKDDKVGIAVPKIYFAPGFEFHRTRYKKEDLGHVFWYAGGIMDWKNVIGHHRGVDAVDKGQFDKIEETEIGTGCCMMIRKEVLEKVGLFDEKYFLYYEDSDLSLHVKKQGFKIVYVPQSIIWHKNAGSAGGSGSKLQDYYITRNRLLFGMRYASTRAKIALLRESLKILLTGRYWQRCGILDFFMARLRKGSFND